jgi:formylglycine-generating enzyme required for sulfatase activity
MRVVAGRGRFGSQRRPSVAGLSVLFAALSAMGSAQSAPSPNAAGFAAWTPVQPNQAAQIAAVKAQTAAMVAAYSAGVGAVDQPPVIWRVKGAITEIWDAPFAPRMVVIPAGEYTMGSADSEPGRKANEGPSHRVRISYPFAVSKYAITVGQFAAFIKDSGHRIEPGACYFYKDAHYQNANACSWRTPGFVQGDNEPVVGISWKDSQAYAAWLSQKTGAVYRLLSEAEFEYADRAGTTTAYWWGDDPLQACAHANGADRKTASDPQFTDWRVNGCDDGYVYTAPVDAFGPNPFGLYGMTGNAFTHIADCWNETYAGAPVDGSAWMTGACGQHVVRGGAWAETPAVLRSAARNWNFSEVQPVTDGLRVARVL